jgi:hypothetical protein
MSKIKVGSDLPVSKAYNINSYALDEKGNRNWQGVERSIIIDGQDTLRRNGAGITILEDTVVITEIEQADWDFIQSEYSTCPHIKQKRIITGKNETEIIATLKATHFADTAALAKVSNSGAKPIKNPMM